MVRWPEWQVLPDVFFRIILPSLIGVMKNRRKVLARHFLKIKNGAFFCLYSFCLIAGWSAILVA